MQAPRAAVVGAGPAGLMAAETLAGAGVAVTIFDRMPAPGRKLLLAGRGGLNLTHSEELPVFLARYGAAQAYLKQAIEAFPPAALRAWCKDLGQPTFIGTSGRVFPQAMKASPLLRAWLARLNAIGVTWKLRHRWLGWDREGRLVFSSGGERVAFAADATIFALGGASWPKLGSDGTWTAAFEAAGAGIAPLRPSNCGFIADLSAAFRERFQGQALKGVALRFGATSVRGEAMITRLGIEGGAVYALSGALRDAIAEQGEASMIMDFRPALSPEQLRTALSKPRGKQSASTFLRKTLGLSPAAIALLHEAARAGHTQLSSLGVDGISAQIKALPLRLTGTALMERAISTAGGVRFASLDRYFMLKGVPGSFLAGEMLDWEARTGGYLLQACFSTGRAAALGALRWLDGKRGNPP